MKNKINILLMLFLFTGCSSTETSLNTMSEHEHTYSQTWSRDGVYHRHESTCEHEIIIDKAEHDYDEGKITKKASCKEHGIKTYTCKVCEFKKTEELPLLEHEFETTYRSDDDYHWYECKNCDTRKDQASHDFNVSYQEIDGEQYKIKTCKICNKVVKGKLGLTKLTSLSDKVTDKGGYVTPQFNRSCLNSEFTLNGFKIEDGISMHPSDNDGFITFDISSYEYDTFVSTIGKTDQQKDCNVRFKVIVDDLIKYESPLIKNAEMEYIEVDIKDAKKLSLCVSNGGDSFSFDESVFAYPTLINKVNLDVVDLTLENLPYVQKVDQDLSLDNVSAIVKYNTGAFKRITKDEFTITNYDKTLLGKQNINITYNDKEFTYELFNSENDIYLNTIQDKWVEQNSYFTPTIGEDCDDQTQFAIGGYIFDNGICIHPKGNEDPGFIKIDLSEINYGKFHTVLGKTRKGIAYDLTFSIYGDEEVLFTKILRPGQFETIDLDISTYQTLKLEVKIGNDNTITYGSSGFADTVIYK